MRNMKRVNFSWKYAVLIIGLIVIAYLVMNFNNRIANLRRLSIQREAVAARLEGLKSTNAILQTQIARATSEAAVIEWAYQEGNLVRPGDNPVVPVPPEGSTPVPTPTPAVPRPQVKPWQMWMWLFVDSGAPVNPK
jgi:cell division protein FtsB